MELVDLNMVDNILKNREFTIKEYVENSLESNNSIEIQVDHIDQEIKNYKLSRNCFIIIGIVMICMTILDCVFQDTTFMRVFLNAFVVLLCVIIVNLDNIVLNKLYLIELANQIIDLYYSKYGQYEDAELKKVLERSDFHMREMPNLDVEKEVK